MNASLPSLDGICSTMRGYMRYALGIAGAAASSPQPYPFKQCEMRLGFAAISDAQADEQVAVGIIVISKGKEQKANTGRTIGTDQAKRRGGNGTMEDDQRHTFEWEQIVASGPMNGDEQNVAAMEVVMSAVLGNVQRADVVEQDVSPRMAAYLDRLGEAVANRTCLLMGEDAPRYRDEYAQTGALGDQVRAWRMGRNLERDAAAALLPGWSAASLALLEQGLLLNSDINAAMRDSLQRQLGEDCSNGER